MGLNHEDIVNKIMKMAEDSQKARGIDNFGSAGFKYQQERAYNDAERDKKWNRIDEEQKRKDLLSNASLERDKAFTLADMQNKRSEATDQRYLDVARIKRYDPLDPEGNFSGNAVPGVGGGGGSRTGSRGSGGKADMSPGQVKADMWKNNPNETPDAINAAYDKFNATKPNAEGVKAFTGEISTAPEASRFPRYDGKPYTPISEPIAQGIGSSVAAQNIPQRSGLSASPSLSVQGSPQLSDVEERNRIRTERQARTGYVPTPNGPGYGYYKGEDLPPVGSYMNGRNGLTEVTPALQEQLRAGTAGTAGTVSQGQYPGVKPGVTAQDVQNVAPTRSLPEQGQPSSSQGMQFNRIVPGMQGERIAEFIRPDGASFFTNNESMIQGATAPKNLSANEKQAVIDSEQMSRERNRKSTDVDKVKLAPLSEQDAKNKEQLSKEAISPQPSDEMPGDWAGGIKRFLERHPGEDASPLSPVIGGNDAYISQPQQPQSLESQQIIALMKDEDDKRRAVLMNQLHQQPYAGYAIQNTNTPINQFASQPQQPQSRNPSMSPIIIGDVAAPTETSSPSAITVEPQRQPINLAQMGDSERRVREERLKDRQNRRTVNTSPSAIVYPTETSSPSAITVEPQRQPINLAQMGDSERRVREEQSKKRKKRRSPDNG